MRGINGGIVSELDVEDGFGPSLQLLLPCRSEGKSVPERTLSFHEHFLRKFGYFVYSNSVGF